MPNPDQTSAINGMPLPSRAGPKTPLLALFVAVLFLFVLTACTSNGDSTSSGGDDSGLTTDDSTDEDGDDAGPADQDGDEDGDEDDMPDGDGPDDSDPSVPAGPGSGIVPDDPNECGIDVINRQPFYAVANIPDDDPDGGLNVRDNFQDGSVLDTLAMSTIVYAVDCAVADDGGVWFAIETGDGSGGWANSAFLSTEISPLKPTSGGEETERLVIAVVDAMATGNWVGAATELLSAPRAFDSIAPLLGQDGLEADLPELLEQYCMARFCDAPYEVVEVRGSYFPDRVSPEVDVRFEYPDGQAIETFTRTWPQNGEFSLRTLPGQSELAWSVVRPTAEALLASGSPDQPEGLLEAAEGVRQALLSGDSASLTSYGAPEGIAVSTSAFVAPEPERRVMVTAVDLASTKDDLRIWGYTDGVGSAIVESIDQWLAGYRSAAALLDPDETSVDERLGTGNTIANISEAFPAARVVEFHRQGRGELEDFNWSSVRLGFEERSDGWVLVAITSDTWTI